MKKNRILHVYSAQMVHHLRGMLIDNPEVFCKFDNGVFFIKARTDAFTNGDEQKFFIKKSRNPIRLIANYLFFRPKYFVFHGGFWPKSWIFMFLLILIGAKCVLISWGGDLEPAAGRKGAIINWLRSQVLRKCYAAVFLSESDLVAARARYGLADRTSVISYYVPEYLDFKNTENADRSEIRENLRIQVGNDASERNGHEICFNLINDLKLKDLNIFIPLGYGRFNLEYYEYIKNRAREVFGDRAEIQEELLPKPAFDALLDTCDAYMMASVEQRALYSVFRHLAAGRAVFLPEMGLLKKDLQAIGFVVYNLQEISNIESGRFFEICRTDHIVNRSIARDVLSLESIRNQWDVLLNNCEM